MGGWAVSIFPRLDIIVVGNKLTKAGNFVFFVNLI